MGKALKNKMMVLGGSIGLALAAGPSHAIGPIEVAGWELDFSGNVNGFYTHSSCSNHGNHGGTGIVAGGLACGSNGEGYTNDSINTGFLPSWFGMSGKTTQNDFNIGFMIGFQPGISSKNPVNGDAGNTLDTGFDLNTSNFRQVFVTFGQDAWGEFKVGRDIGIFGKDIILNDMTLLGVGVTSDFADDVGGNTTLGRLGTGYMYPDWRAQISYTSPTFFGVHAQFGIFAPWGLQGIAGTGSYDAAAGGYVGGLSMGAGEFRQKGNTPRFEGRMNWDWEMPGMDGDLTGSLYVTGIYQRLDTARDDLKDKTAHGFEIGGKTVIYKDLDLVYHYYSGKGIGTSNFLFDAMAKNGKRRESDGFYLQARYVVPWIGTKLGVAYGESNLDLASGEAESDLVEENQAWTFGAYHPLTESLTLTTEYTIAKSNSHSGNESEEHTVAVGAFLFY